MSMEEQQRSVEGMQHPEHRFNEDGIDDAWGAARLGDRVFGGQHLLQSVLIS